MAPALSIIMAVYNGEAHLEECVDSILAQVFTDFEFIIVDDASIDATSQILADYARRDRRVIILTNATNMERSVSRNRAIAVARAPFIAVMDADDWAYPDRFSKQYAFMLAHPEIAVCGTSMEEYETGRVHIWEGSGEAVRVRLLFGCCIFHPTVIARRDALLALGGYSPDLYAGEDYDLWVRMVTAGYAMACLPEVLLRYRVYPGEMRTGYKWQMHDVTERIHRRQLELLGIYPTRLEYDRHLFCQSPCPETQTGLSASIGWMSKLITANDQLGIYNRAVFAAAIREMQQAFTLASLRDEPWQYFRRLARNVLCHILSALRLDPKYERAFINRLRVCGFSSASKKD